ncbi:probable G-protein coupled receptor Mth-like 5 [Sitodiplosis mosellana]|uniref:probable G-protein coupled receptor Mth-like 5 n=1 Tax=Sitodiplosis mosellana TaxID=263140 RepID=UPI00244393FE|nr:probable G-protein coupled receptor Mth-like 5 [Sitodiplosis mosellana]
MFYYKLTTILLIVLLVLCRNCRSFRSDYNNGSVRVNKCCEPNEILVDLRCANANESNQEVWSPIFTGFDGKANAQVPGFWFAVGIPQCSQKQMWPIYYYPTSRDRLALLPDGRLRHYIQNSDDDDNAAFDSDVEKSEETMLYDYAQGQYCMDRAVATKGITYPSEFAMVCSPEKESNWKDTDFLLRKVVNPVCHGISITILLVVGICYFVVPSLRDLVGNIITTITCCLIVGQVANLMRIFTEFRNHFNFLILDILAEVSVMATFFWLSSLGYFIWKTFRQRNVFLRVTDGKKYCWYSFYAWGSTLCMASLGTFAHLFLDINIPKKNSLVDEHETIGVLCLLVFFVTNCIVIGLSIYFYVSTQNYLSNRLNASYGRIHHKLKSNFIMFALLLILLTVSYVLTLISWIEYEGMFYINLAISAIQAPLVLYICVLRQKHVTYLLQKACCSKQPLSGADWGDEMTYINTAH